MEKITVEVVVGAPVERVWKFFTEPEHVTKWNHASDDWHSPRATNDLRTGGTFSYRMESKDGTEGFDFGGTYEDVIPHERMVYIMDGEDARKVETIFEPQGAQTKVITSFDPEQENSPEFQRQGWQAILDNFKRYAEEA